VVLTADADKKNTAGREPIDALVMFCMLVCSRSTICRTSRLSIRRATARRSRIFLALGIEDRVPDGTTLRLFREKLAKLRLIEKRVEQFSRSQGLHHPRQSDGGRHHRAATL
jgi:IS5 family transposase